MAPEGFDAIRVEEARSAYLAEVENLCERLASDVRVLVEVVDAATLRRATAHGQTARHRLRRQPAGSPTCSQGVPPETNQELRSAIACRETQSSRALNSDDRIHRDGAVRSGRSNPVSTQGRRRPGRRKAARRDEGRDNPLAPTRGVIPGSAVIRSLLATSLVRSGLGLVGLTCRGGQDQSLLGECIDAALEAACLAGHELRISECVPLAARLPHQEGAIKRDREVARVAPRHQPELLARPSGAGVEAAAHQSDRGRRCVCRARSRGSTAGSRSGRPNSAWSVSARISALPEPGLGRSVPLEQVEHCVDVLGIHSNDAASTSSSLALK